MISCLWCYLALKKECLHIGTAEIDPAASGWLIVSYFLL